MALWVVGGERGLGVGQSRGEGVIWGGGIYRTIR